MTSMDIIELFKTNLLQLGVEHKCSTEVSAFYIVIQHT
jgi:hypothetical protein